MTTILLALGVFGSSGSGESGPSDVTTPTTRIITLTQAGTSAVATQTLDPTDVLDFIIKLDSITDEPSEDFSAITLVVVPASSALGFQVLSTPPYEPEEVSNSQIRIWATVDAPSRGLPAWSGQGTLCSIEVTATTDSTPPRIFQRTGSIRVAQK